MIPLIPTRIHGMLDYAMGLLLMLSPWMFGFAANGPETWIPVTLGAGAIVYSLLTAYELGAARVIPMNLHLVFDAVAGALLAVSPWVFNFSHYVWVPHVVLGLLEIGAALMTDPRPRSVPGAEAPLPMVD
jgi:hypothetical protein